jgi:hypothetical protein
MISVLCVEEEEPADSHRLVGVGPRHEAALRPLRMILPDAWCRLGDDGIFFAITGILHECDVPIRLSGFVNRQFVASTLPDCGFTATKKPTTRTGMPSNTSKSSRRSSGHFERFFGPTGTGSVAIASNVTSLSLEGMSVLFFKLGCCQKGSGFVSDRGRESLCQPSVSRGSGARILRPALSDAGSPLEATNEHS